jgi:RNA polymerase sigma-70 factor (ECF subfamily)
MPHLNDLYRTALYLLHLPVKASTAVEETYLRARETYGEIPRGTNCKTWLFQILIHVVRQTRMQPMGVASAMRSNKSSSSVLSAMNRIPQDSREVVLLVDGQGFSYRDAAAILGLSTEVVTHHIVNGRSHLQSELECSRSTLVAVAQ